MTRPTYQLDMITAEKGGDPLASERLPLPDDLDLGDLADYLADCLGEPTDLAVADTDEFGRITVGWVFEAPSGDQQHELIVIPEVILPGHDDAVWVFLHEEQLKREFIAVMTEAGVGVQVVQGGSR